MILKGSNRLIRGGSWNNEAANCEAAYRNGNQPANRWNNNGLVLALNSAEIISNDLGFHTEQILFQMIGLDSIVET